VSEVLVLGGDGFCGWATSLHLADQGYNVTIVDNLSRRRIDQELEVESLTPIASIEDRLAAWEEVAGSDKKIDFKNINVADVTDDGSDGYSQLVNLIAERSPLAIVHFAEQRSAPYSMKSPRTRRYTVNNNEAATNNLLTALVETGKDSHVVHLGTMGVYGYGTSGGAEIPEGYLKVKINTPDGEVEQEILHPTSPGSIYHTTKVMDQSLLAFSAKNDEIRVTDLHQGIVWGTQTEQTARHDSLMNRFDYDGDYGTVLNRFIVEAAVGHPLTVHGSGGQTRAFIHIQDTVRCVEAAIKNPPKKGDRPDIYNQVSETHRLIDLAKLVSSLTGAKIEFVSNPRKEAASNDLNVNNDTLSKLGLIKLSDGLIDEIGATVEKYTDRVDLSKIPATSLWQQVAPSTV
jgi:UDP-sulfoquinovose synthase